MPEIFAGLSLFGLVAVCALSSLFCLFQPIWSLVDCIDSDRERETKVLVSIAIVFTWGVGSFVYGIFFTASRNLRRFTIVSTLVMLGLVVVALGSCVSAIATHSKRVTAEAESREAEMRRRAAAFVPAFAPADAVAPFHALLVSRTGRHSSTTALAEFTLAGPFASTARDVRGGVRHVAHDAVQGRTFALTQHDFGALSPRTGEFIEIAVDPSFEFSWPKGLAWDAQAQRVVVMTSHVYTHFLTYDPNTSVWDKLPTAVRDLSLSGLAYLPGEELLYALVVGPRATEVGELQRFNRHGANLGRVGLVPAIPIADAEHASRAQLQASSGKLVLLIQSYDPTPPAGAAETGAAAIAPGSDRIFLIDPQTGAVAAHGTDHATVLRADAAARDARPASAE